MKPKDGNFTRRNFMLAVGAIPASGIALKGAGARAAQSFSNRAFEVAVIGSEECLWSYRLTPSGREHRVAPPVFNIDGQTRVATLGNVKAKREPQRLPNGSTEYSYEGTFAALPDFSLTLVFQVAEENPVVRFSYVLKSSHPHSLTKPEGADELQYFKISFRDFRHAKEIRLCDFHEIYHSYILEENVLEPRAFAHRLEVMGPIVAASGGKESLLVAYEHGSQAPDAFLRFELHPNRQVALQAVKGNYLTGQRVDVKHPYQTLWLEMGAVAGGEDQLASAFRAFVLKHMTQNPATRQPLIYYNTWNRQERDKWWYGKEFGTALNTHDILEDIDIAHRMGIDVYVIDGGWSDKAGDWTVDRNCFPDGLHTVKKRLDRYGMQLGLWFGPRSASVPSKTLTEYQDCIATVRGKKTELPFGRPGKTSYGLCLVSRYIDAYVERMIAFSKEVGVTYFKWDAVMPHCCDAPGHWHGDASHTREEREASHDFQLVRQVARAADRIAAACPGAVVDIDSTETERLMGLGFLAAGRIFAINNGPYYHSYDIPEIPNHYTNIFAFPGPARTWVCRSMLTYDKWIPSLLLMCHYFPDDPLLSQEINMASLVLGQNGIWGDLPRVSDAGVRYIAETLAQYKKVWNDMAAADPVITGGLSGSPEIYEKIDARTGRGAVVMFAMSEGKYTYVTSRRVSQKYRAGEGVKVRLDSQGRARLEVTVPRNEKVKFPHRGYSPAAKIIFFGAD